MATYDLNDARENARGRNWSDHETAYLIEHGVEAAATAFNRSVESCQSKYNRLGLTKAGGKAPSPPPVAPAPEPPQVAPRIIADKKIGTFNWREANTLIKGMQDLKSRASSSQDTANIIIDTDDPITVLALSDTHALSWGTDHELLEKITDEILSTKNLYVALLGDLAQMSIKLRSVAEVSDNMLPPDLQLAYIDSWLQEIADRILFCTWDNHAVDREETASGISAFAKLQSRRFVYHSHIGHPDVTVGGETYRMAVSHRFLGRSIENPCHGTMRYLRREGHDREIAIMGDYHVPGIVKFTHGHQTKLAINTGSFQTNSGYAKRWFSLFTHPVMPCFTLYPDHHDFTPFWSVAEWKAATDAGKKWGRVA